MIKFNIVFYLLIIIAVVFLWFILAFLFKPLGKFFSRLLEDVKREMELEEKDEG